MPIIPIIQQQRPTADAAAPVLDRERRPTVDTSEVQGRLARVNESNKMPLMDPQAMAAPYEALGSVGRAVQQAGNLLGALAIKRQEAEADFQAAEFEKRMNTELADFENWKAGKSNVPMEWEPEWQKRLGKLRQEYGANKNLNRLARDEIGLRLTRWEGQSMAGVARDATKHTFELAKSATIASADTALVNGDWEGHERIVKDGEAKGYLFPHVANAMRLESRQSQVQAAKLNADTELAQNNLEGAKAAIAASPMPEAQKKNELANIEFRHGQKQEFDAIKAMAFENPEMAAEMAAEKEKAGKLTPLMRIELQEQAKFNRASMVREAVADYKGRLQLGERIDAETLDNDQRLNEEAKSAVARMADGIQNMPAEFERALVQAMAYDPATFGSEMEAITEATNLEASFEASFDGARLQSLKAELDKRRRGSDIATAATDIGPALKLLDESIDAGGLDHVVGPVLVPERDEAGNIILEKTPDVTVRGRFERNAFGKWWSKESHYDGAKTIKGGEMVPKMKADPVASEKAAAIQREIRRTIEAEVKSGKLKGQDEIATRAIDLFTLKGGKLPPAANTSAGTQNPLLPPLKTEKTDLNEILKKYGH